MIFSVSEIVIYFILINIITFTLFRLDKKSAIDGTWRITERTLIIFCLLGGTPAGFFAGKIYRHKTSDQSFKSKFVMVYVLQGFMIACLIIKGLGLV